MNSPTNIDPVQTLVARMRDGAEPTTSELQSVLGVLGLWLARRGLSVQDREDVCSEALGRLVRAVRANDLDPARPPGAWLRVVADHLALDVLRRESIRTGAAFDEGAHAPRGEDDRLAALLDREASRQAVDEVLQRAAAEDRTTLVNVITTWRGLAQMNDEAPSTHQVADRLGVSHTTVGRALADMREMLSPRSAFQSAEPARKRLGAKPEKTDSESIRPQQQKAVTPIRRYP
jgi:DNA-directed RNA polymerase specialized sigma24 family protein